MTFPTRIEPRRGSPRRGSLADHVHRRLRRRLTRGGFLPEQAVSIRTLAAEMKVGAMPVRDALTRLVATGALVASPNRAIRLPALTRAALAEITEMRVLLEGFAAERAAGAPAPRDAARLRRHCAAMQNAADRGDIDDYLLRNACFHFRLYRASGLPLLVATIEDLWLRVGPSIRLCMPDSDHLARSMEAHRCALAAVETGDPAAARAAVEDDIRTAAADMDRTLARRERNAE